VYDDDLTNLEDWMRRLKVEYDIFLNGNRKKPPDDLRMRVEKLVKKLSECSDLNFQQRFRYNTLVARFYVYRDLWRRRIQDMELGAGGPGPATAGQTTSPVAPAAEKEIKIRLSDPAKEEEKVRQLYNALLRMRGTQAEETLRISYPQFAKYITTQTRDIRTRYDCPSVVFTVAIEDNAIKITAKAENSR
jgi:hypothetical protein